MQLYPELFRSLEQARWKMEPVDPQAAASVIAAIPESWRSRYWTIVSGEIPPP